jgi:hypothetical protein
VALELHHVRTACSRAPFDATARCACGSAPSRFVPTSADGSGSGRVGSKRRRRASSYIHGPSSQCPLSESTATECPRLFAILTPYQTSSASNDKRAADRDGKGELPNTCARAWLGSGCAISMGSRVLAAGGLRRATRCRLKALDSHARSRLIALFGSMTGKSTGRLLPARSVSLAWVWVASSLVCVPDSEPARPPVLILST